MLFSFILLPTLILLLGFLAPMPVQATTSPITATVAPLTSTSSIEAYITSTALNEGVSPVLARKIAWAESQYVYTAKNPNSSASGVFQMIHSTWITTMTRMGRATTTSPFDARQNIEAGIFLLKNDGTHHWDASSNHWNT